VSIIEDTWAPMRVLMIGGNGLIGSSIVSQLRARDDQVWIVSRGLSHRPFPPGCIHVVADRGAAGFANAVAELPTFDCVIDMVCYQPEEAVAAVDALASRTGQYVFTSTIDVYQKPASHYPYREDENYGGIGSYAAAKVACELALFEAYERQRFPLTVIRPAATYGPLHPPVHSLGRGTAYLDRLRRGKPIVVHGDGSSFWVSCHADDVATAFLGATGNERAIGRAYHVTGEEWVTWDQHHQILARSIGAPEPKFVHIPTDDLVELAGERAQLARDNLQFNNIFDNTAARSELGFRYTVPLERGLAGWYRSLDEAGMIVDSDDEPFDDILIDRWESGRRAIPAVHGNI
jgi:nucleoside-diphosphate-sugar epimerase